MSAKKTTLPFFARFALLVAVTSSALAQTSEETKAASVLSSHFESVFFAKTVVLSSVGPYKGMDERSIHTLRLPFAELFQGLKLAEPPNSESLVDPSEAIMVGAKNFLPPAGLGPVRSERCYIIVLKPDHVKSLGQYFSRSTIVEREGMQIWKWSARLGEFGEDDPKRSTTLYATQLGGVYALIANNIDDLLTTSKALKTAEDSPSSPTIDRSSAIANEIWAFRKVDREVNRNMDASGLHGVSGNVAAITYFVDFEKADSVIRLLTLDSEHVSTPTIGIIALPDFHYRGDRLWQAEVPFSWEAAHDDSSLRILDRFGFGLYL
jgi:hypothetical protein